MSSVKYKIENENVDNDEVVVPMEASPLLDNQPKIECATSNDKQTTSK